MMILNAKLAKKNKGASSKKPLVSCLMISNATGRRLIFLQQSIECFCRQEYPKKELIILMNGISDPQYKKAKKLISSFSRNDIRVFRTKKSSLSMGTLRNLVVRKASGDFFCQWDDDDLFHSDRIAVQLRYLIANKLDAVFLQDHLYYNKKLNSISPSSWISFPIPLHPGSGMFRVRARLKYPVKGERYPKSGPILGEDSLAIMDLLLRKKRLGVIRGQYHLFVYIFHGKNLTHAQHHEELLSILGKPAKLSKREKEAISRSLAEWNLRAKINISN